MASYKSLKWDPYNFEKKKRRLEPRRKLALSPSPMLKTTGVSCPHANPERISGSYWTAM